MAGVGRPPSEHPAINQLRIRLTDEELARLNACSKAYGTTKSNVVRRGIDILYNDLQGNERK